MREFVHEDLRGARIEHTDLRDASFDDVDLAGSRMRLVDLSDVDVRGARVHGLRLRGAELSNVEISAELDRVVVNGVEIGPLVEAELNRRDPDRTKMRPDAPDGFREAWAIVERRWNTTIDAARELPASMLHERVDGEWSFIETLRHLNFASAAWVSRMILGDPGPWHPLDLPWDEAPDWDGIPRDRTIRPTLDEVLAVRSDRHATVSGVIDGLDVDQLASTVSCTEPGFPTLEDFPLAECLRIVLNEEWEHRNFAARDLAALASPAGEA